MKNIIISFSGIDSAGKTTYISMLKKYFDENNVKYKYIWSRGGYTNGFELIKKITRFFLRKRLPPSGSSHKRTEMLKNTKVSSIWYIIAMIDLIRLYSISIPLYKLFGYNIILDRYFWDTYVDFHFMFPKKLNGFLWKILESIYKKPNISIIYYISAELSYYRSIVKKEPFLESIEKRKQRIDIYDDLIKNKKWDILINTEFNSIEESWRQTISKIKRP
jgi:dTMP kinase